MSLFKNIAVASTFSPRFLPLLAETKQIAQGFDSSFSVIHAGPECEQSKSRFAEAMAQLGLSPEPPIHWAEGEPGGAIVRKTTECGVDLLVAGALERETTGRHYVGDVTRELMLEAQCSLLFLINPGLQARSFRQIAAIVDFSETSALSLRYAYFLASRHAAECIHLIRVFTIFSQALGQPEEFFENRGSHQTMLATEEQRMLDFATEVGPSPVPLETKCIEGTTGFAASEYVEALKADLLVLPSQPPGAAQLFPPGTDWIANAIPSNLLIVRR